jgi:hypothetical protein
VAKGGDEVKAEALAIPHHHFAELKCDDVLRHFAVNNQVHTISPLPMLVFASHATFHILNRD